MFLQCAFISRRMQYLIFNWRQLGENTADQSTSGSNSSRAAENQTMVLFWLLTGLKFRVFWYINHYVLKKKVFHLIRGYTSEVMKPLQFFPKLLGGIPNGFFLQISCSYGGNQKIPLSDNNYGLPEISPYYKQIKCVIMPAGRWRNIATIKPCWF